MIPADDCQRAEAIALYVEGDLEEAAARRLERHLGACPACRAFADEMAASQQTLRRQLAPPFDEATLARMRADILGEIARRRRAAAARWLALAATLLAAVAVWRILEPRPTPPQAPEPAIAVPAPTEPSGTLADSEAAAEPSPAARAVAPAPRLPTREPAPPPPAAPEPVARRQPKPLMIKLVSPDQDLVIYWTVEPTDNKESEHEAATVL